MNDTLVYALAIYSVGCIVPSELEREQPPMNYPPSWLTDQVAPPFTTPITLMKTQDKEITLFATDPNPDDTLYARLFLLNGTTYSEINAETQLMKQAPTGNAVQDLTRTGQFGDYQYCLNLNSGTYTLVAVVADKNWMGNGIQPVAGGLIDTNHWELQCL